MRAVVLSLVAIGAEAFAPTFTPTLNGLAPKSAMASARASKTVVLMSGNSKVKNENPDDFATYLAKRQAAEAGVPWVPAGGAPAPAAAAAPAPAAPVYVAPAAVAPPAAAPPAAAPPAAKAPAKAPAPAPIDKDPAFAAAKRFEVDERMMTATYSPEIEAQRAVETKFYLGLGFSDVEAKRVAARLISYTDYLYSEVGPNAIEAANKERLKKEGIESIDKDPAFAAEKRFVVDEAMFSATYSPEIEAQRKSQASFYEGLGLTGAQASRLSSRLVAYSDYLYSEVGPNAIEAANVARLKKEGMDTVDHDPAFSPEKAFVLDEAMFTATYAPEIEAERTKSENFYKAQGMSDVQAKRLAARLVSYGDYLYSVVGPNAIEQANKERLAAEARL